MSLSTATVPTDMGIMKSPLRRGVVIAIPAITLLVAMGLSTHFVRIGASSGGAVAFSPETFGKTEFPKIQAEVVRKAVDAPVFAKAVMADKDKAASQYGVPGNIGPEISVKFTGTAGTAVSGVYPVTVPGLPDDIHVRVQTGPAINGTDLRDATGTVTFGQFTNQIDYQNAGAALNKEMKTQILSKIDTKNLAGKNVTVVGVFQLINPKNWLVTPVQVSMP